MKHFVAAMLFAVSAFAPPLQAQALVKTPLDKVVAVVEDDVILRSDLDRAVNNIMAQYAGRSAQLPPKDVIERQVLDRMILIRLQIQRAAGTGVRISDSEIDQALAAMARQNNMDMNQMRASLARDGYSYDEFRGTMREELTVQRLRQRFVQARVNVTDTEVDLLLSSGSIKKGEVRLSHILIGVPDGARPDVVAEAKAKAEKVRTEIEGGLDFASAAIRYSQGQQALEGGDLGWRRYDEVPSAFAEVVNTLKRGEVTPAMRGPSGFHIIKLMDERENSKQVVREYHARHILVKVSEVVPSDEANGSAASLRQRILAGESFEKLAKQFSDDKATGTLGGDMGWFPLQGYGTRVAETIEQLKDGEISQPFQTEAGWHIMERLGMRDVDRTADYDREQARDAIRNRKAEEEYDAFLREVRGESYIENRLTGKSNAAG